MKTDLIIQNNTFNCYLCELKDLETDRIYCKHDRTHLIEVARIMLELNEKYNYKLSHDIIVATALLHDLLRVEEYKTKVDHRECDTTILEQILTECTYSKEDIVKIISAIKSHKHDSDDPLSSLLYKADKLSRPCYICKAKDSCYWDEKLKNKEYYNANRK